MDLSLENKILERIKKAKRGALFFASDFASYGSTASCNKALERLAKRGDIMRVGRGIYAIPKKSKLFGFVTPPIEAIASDIARRDKARIIPTGQYALHALGLSTQIPMKAVYLTDGAPRKITIGNRVLIFKKTAPKNLASYGKLSGLAIQALKSLGKENVDDSVENKIIAALQKETPENLAHDIKLAPEWIRSIMRKAQTNTL